jgi:hypothetical protein
MICKAEEEVEGGDTEVFHCGNQFFYFFLSSEDSFIKIPPKKTIYPYVTYFMMASICKTICAGLCKPALSAHDGTGALVL